LILSDSIVTPSGSLTLDYIISALTRPLNRYFIQFTVNQAIISSIITVIIGLPGAYIFARYHFLGKNTLKIILTVPFVLPPIVVVLGFILLIGPNGIFNTFLMDLFDLREPPIILYKTFEGIILVHAFYNVPIVLHLVSSAWSKSNIDMEDVATTLGSRKTHFFRYIRFPQISSAILASGILTFLYCFTSFAIVLSLGGVQYRTLEVQIYSLYHYRYDYQQAATLALFQLIITSLLILFYLYFSEPIFLRERKSFFSRIVENIPIKIIFIVLAISFLLMIRVDPILIILLTCITIFFWKFGRVNPLAIGEIRSLPTIPLKRLFYQNKSRVGMILFYLFFLIVFLFSPIVIIFLYAFFDRKTNSWNIDGFFALLGFKQTNNGLIFAPESIPALGANVSALNLIFNSVFFAFTTMLLSGIFGIISVYAIRRSAFLSKHRMLATIVSWSFILPMVTSSITIGLGMLRAFGSINLSSNDAWLPIIIAHLIAAYPFVSRTVSTAYNKVDYSQIEIAQTLGASRWYIFRNIEFPVIFSGILAGVTFALAISFGEFGATYFIARSEFTTMTIGIYKFLDLRQLQNSALMASILIIVCIFSFLIVQKLGSDEFQF
jgi:thiamine transport system permease protein